MAVVKIIKGDVTQPVGSGKKVIAHVANDIGIMGSGVAGALRRKWESVGRDYETWYQEGISGNSFKSMVLGQIQFVRVAHDISVCNMIGQRGVGGEEIDGEFVPPIKYESLKECLLRLRLALKKVPGVSLHLPMLGSGLSKGDWFVIYSIIREVFDETDIDITIYAFDDINLELAEKTHRDFELMADYERRCEAGEEPLFPDFS